MGKLFLGISVRLFAALAAVLAVFGSLTVARADVASTPTLGSNITLFVAADGSGPFTYQWKKKIGTSTSFVDIVGATSSTYLLSNIQVTDAGSYSVTVTNSLGSITSDLATFTFTGIAPVIVTQPQASVAVAPGGNASMTVVASGGPIPTSFQWKKGGVDVVDGGVISGATTATLTFTGVTIGDAGNYTVVVGNGVAPTVTSNVSALIVGATAPTISVQPAASQTVTAGTNVNFTVTASGVPTPGYQWKKNGVNMSNGGNVSGATSATLTLTSVTATDSATYTVVVDNTISPAVTSNNAVLTVNGVAPSISTQPASQTVDTGAAASFSVVASGSPTLTYQWQKDSVNISGATSSSYAIASAQSSDAGSYTVTVTNSFGSAPSSAATLTVNAPPAPPPTPPTPTTPPPVISTQPQATSVVSGRNVSFHFASTGGTSVFWQVSSNGGATWSTISNNLTYSGATTSTLVVNNATESLNGLQYRAVARNAGGDTTSSAVTLGVLAPVLFSPGDVVVTSAGQLLVSDNAMNVIRTINPNTGVSSVAAGIEGGSGANNTAATSSQFRQPAGLVLDQSGNLYIVDTGNSLVRRLGTNNQVTTVAGSDVNQGSRDGTGTDALFNLPLGVTVDSSGNFYVADTGNSIIRKITSTGAVTTLAGVAGARGFADGTGSAARFNQPTGIAADSAGNLYVADTLNQTIRKITPAGAVSTFAGVPGVSGIDNGTGSGALFSLPWGIAIDSVGNLYVADSGNSTIRRITPAGVVTTIAGLPTISGQQDGTGFDALFNQPRGLRVDSTGNLYVADNGNSTIRRISTASAVTTLAITRAADSPAPTTPTSPSTPTTPTTPTGSSGSSSGGGGGGGGGGGAPSGWFLLALATAALARFHARRRLAGN